MCFLMLYNLRVAYMFLHVLKDYIKVRIFLHAKSMHERCQKPNYLWDWHDKTSKLLRIRSHYEKLCARRMEWIHAWINCFRTFQHRVISCKRDLWNFSQLMFFASSEKSFCNGNLFIGLSFFPAFLCHVCCFITIQEDKMKAYRWHFIL